jgi:hypothetical protein
MVKPAKVEEKAIEIKVAEKIEAEPSPATAKTGLAGLAAAHTSEAPKHDAQLETPARAAYGSVKNLSPEERRALRTQQARDRRAGLAPKRELQAPPKKEVVLSDAEKKNKLDVGAKTLTGATIGFFVSFFGPSFKDGATGQDDKDILFSGWRNWLEAHEFYFIPPSLGLALAILAYIFPRNPYQMFKDWREESKKKKEAKKEKERPKEVSTDTHLPAEKVEIYVAPRVTEKVQSGAPSKSERFSDEPSELAQV